MAEHPINCDCEECAEECTDDEVTEEAAGCAEESEE